MVDWLEDGVGRKAGKILNDPSKHYPNKAEAECLRYLMATTGLTEVEVRAKIKYRRMLAEAQKIGEAAKRSPLEKFYARLVRRACRKTKLAKEHPETLKALQKIIDDLPKYRYYWRTFYELGKTDLSTLKAKTVLEGSKKPPKK